MYATSIWTVATDLVTALKAGINLLTEEPVSYFLVLGVVMTGLNFARRLVVRSKD